MFQGRLRCVAALLLVASVAFAGCQTANHTPSVNSPAPTSNSTSSGGIPSCH